MQLCFRTNSMMIKLSMCLGIALWCGGLYAESLFPDISRLPAQANSPDPLVSMDGSRITSHEQWFKKRRPELKRLFEHYMYGTMPPVPERLQFMVERDGEDFFNGKAAGKEVTISFDKATNAPKIHVLLIVPKNHARQTGEKELKTGGEGAGARQLYSFPTELKWRGFPVFLGLNFCGNFALTSNREVAVPEGWMGKACPGCVDEHATEAGRGGQTE